MISMTSPMEIPAHRNTCYNSDRDVRMLDRHPEVRKLFIKYNTAIASIAPVERLFSTGALVLSKRRSRLSDSLFETAVKSECTFLAWSSPRLLLSWLACVYCLNT